MAKIETLKRSVSLCPECLKNISAEVVWDKEENKIFMVKTCPEHGDFKDRLSSNPEDFLWQQMYTSSLGSDEGNSTQPEDLLKNTKGCPYSCGLCEKHKSAPCIALIDLTNRCNLRCPVCFANSAVAGYIYEPTFDEIVQIMEHFRNIKPIPPILLQLSGGEPTIREDLFDIIRKGVDLGFVNVMLTTNGIKLAKSVDYCKQLIDAGLNSLYFSFDGIEPETWKQMRGVDLSKIKMQVLKNCREAGFAAANIGIVLVPTIVNGINDHEIGNIIDVAREFSDIVMGIVFQPVSLTGRIAIEDLNKMRYTTSDLKEAVNKHTEGLINKFYPLSLTSKMTRLIAWLEDEPAFSMTSHQDCGFATIGVLDDDNNWQPIEKFFDVDGIIKFSNETFDLIQKRKLPKVSHLIDGMKNPPKLLTTIMQFTDTMTDLAYREVMKLYYMAGAARFFKGDITQIRNNQKTFLNFLKIMWNPNLDSVADFFLSRNIMISSMHFQDAYNFDLERIQRCLVHYGVINPEDRSKVLEIPFCAMNTLHRPVLEKALAVVQETKTVDQLDNEVSELIQQFAK
ncbi:MAG: radical SAM protein [Candidatus Lokiarchaeota archaeon]|nr:radical SAM protein [Candidatus Lokiarchaeota archaeon]